MEQKKEQCQGADVKRDAHLRRPPKSPSKTIIQLTRNAERGIRSLLSILTLLSWKGCARLYKTFHYCFIGPLCAAFLYQVKIIKKYLRVN
jgi:hypothetical protein